MNKPLRIAFLGVDHPHGAGWRDLLLNFQSRLALVSIVPRFGGATASLEERYRQAARFDSVDELIADGQFDAAVVCLPNNESADAIVRLAEAGKHILAEKPAAGSGEAGRRIAQAVRAAGVAFQNGYTWRYDEASDRLRDMVADGRFGKLISIEASYVTSDVARRGPQHYLFDATVSRGGFFNWLACHYLDLLLYIVNEPVVGVTARVGVFGDTQVGVEDGGTALLDLASGGLVTLTGGYWLPRWAGENHWCFRGSKRWVHWDPARRGTSGVLEIHGPQPQWYPMEETLTLSEDTTPGYGGMRGMRLVEDWLESIEHGGRDCNNTVESTLATLELLDAIYQASAGGKRIECHIGPG